MSTGCVRGSGHDLVRADRRQFVLLLVRAGVDPKIAKRPVIVLSNNDGCAVARTPEAKALGIGMGEPYFKIRDLCRDNDVAVFSSNYTLYGDMSARLNTIYRQWSPDVEVYSIDESFLDMTDIRPADRAIFGRDLRSQVQQWTGIPTCVGIGPTKTLAKFANHVAKKNAELGGVCDLTDAKIRQVWLDRIEVGEVWGVGAASERKLFGLGIETAGDLARVDARLARNLLSVVGERTVLELQGISCLPLEDVPPQRKGCAGTGWKRPIWLCSFTRRGSIRRTSRTRHKRRCISLKRRTTRSI
jgi:DNA polymerase V